MSKDIQPEKASEHILIEYWKCNVVGHRHQSARAASSCIVKRKGESGTLKKLKRNLSMLVDLKKGHSIISISKNHFCSDANVTKTVSSTLNKAWKAAAEGGGCPYRKRTWKREDFTNPALEKELSFLTDILLEMEVKLASVVESE